MSTQYDKLQPGAPVKGRAQKAGVASSRPGEYGSDRFAFLGLFLFTLLLYARPNDLFPETLGEFPLVKIIAITTLVVYFVSKLSQGVKLTIRPLELWMLAVITLLGVIFTPIAADPQDSIDVLWDYFLKVVAIFVLLINLIDTRKRLLLMMKLTVICGTVLATDAVLSHLAGKLTTKAINETGQVTLARITGVVGGIFGNPNDLATSLDLLLPLAVALALIHHGVMRAVYFACGALLFAGVVVTFSRSGFLGLVAMGALLLWKLGRYNRALTALAFFLTIGVFVAAMPGDYGGRVLSIFNIEGDPTGSAQTRREMFDHAAGLALNHPFIGVGMGNFHIYSIREQVAHNSYLEIAAELGLAGLAAYLAFIFAPIRSLRRVERDASKELATSARKISADNRDNGERGIYYLSVGLQGAFVAYMVCSFFSSIQYLWYLYFPAAFAIALSRIHAAESASTPDETAPKGMQPPKGVLWRPRQRAGSLADGAARLGRLGR